MLLKLLTKLCDSFDYCVFLINKVNWQIKYVSYPAQALLRLKEEVHFNDSALDSGAIVVVKDAIDALADEETIFRKINLLLNDEMVTLSFAFSCFDMEHVLVDVKQEYSVSQNNSIIILEEKLSAITRLSDGIAHNLRSPLMALRGISDYMVFLVANWERILEQGCLDCKLRKDKEKTSYLLRQMREDIRDNVTVITDIINDLKAYNKVDRFNDFVFTDIQDLIYKVIKMLEYNTKLAAEIVFVPSSKKLPLIYCVPSDIQVVLTNLIENAIEQILTTKTKHGKILVLAKQQEKNIVIKVKDNGGGIVDDVLRQDRLFEPFVTTKKNEGTGFGLHSSFKIVKEHGGNIYAKNHNCKIGKGAEFVVILPIKNKHGEQ